MNNDDKKNDKKYTYVTKLFIITRWYLKKIRLVTVSYAISQDSFQWKYRRNCDELQAFLSYFIK